MNQASNIEKNTSLATEMIIDFTNFVETAIHQILYGERIYPENIFEDKSIYGLEVKILKRNVLYDYVHELCIKLEDLIRRDILESIQIRVCKDGEKPAIYEIEIEKTKKFDQMDSLPDKFEFDAYLKRFLYSIIEQRKPLTTEAISPKNTFEVGIISSGRESLDEAAKLLLIQDWVISSKGKQTQDVVDQGPRVKLIENALFAEFTMGLYLHKCEE